MDALHPGQPVLVHAVHRGRLAARAVGAAHRRDRLAGPPPRGLMRRYSARPIMTRGISAAADKLVRSGVDPAITGELPEERAARGLTRTGRVRPVIAGFERSPVTGGKRGGTAVRPRRSGRVVLVA